MVNADLNRTDTGSKRKFETIIDGIEESGNFKSDKAIDGINQPSEEKERDEINEIESEGYSEEMYNKMKTAIEGFKSRTVIEYETDPEVNFLDKLVRRSLYFPLKNDLSNEIELWEMPCTLRLSSEFHTEAFFFILENSINCSENVLMEYFLFIYDKWIGEYSDPYESVEIFLVQICELSIQLNFHELFEISFKQIESESNGLKVLQILSKWASSLSIEIDRVTNYKWETMCLIVIKLFPSFAYNPVLRLKSSMDFEESNRSLFLHFLPILRTLLITSLDEFEANAEAFDNFVILHATMLESNYWTVMNQMFLKSRINLSAFDSEEEISLKTMIVQRIFDFLFIRMEGDNVVELLLRKKAFSIFESYMKYSGLISFTEPGILSTLSKLIEGAKNDYSQTIFILAFVAYIKIPKSVWNALNASLNAFSLNYISEAVENVEFDLNLKRAEKIPFPATEFNGLNYISDIFRIPKQLDVGRVFLARACGIPMEMTNLIHFARENFEWREIVGFVNFYVDRAAGLSGYTGDHLEFIVA